MQKKERLVLVTGATGYIGGRLIPRLLEKGHTLRCLVRHSESLAGRPWEHLVETRYADVLVRDSLDQAMEGVDTAYYLIHSMAGGKGFHQRDVSAAENFALAAKKAGVRRIIYLGGLANPEDRLSEHLRSRQKTGEILRSSGIPVTEFRAAVIIGSGSISFEIIRHLTERLPVMICPKWVYTKTQPIGILDVLEYLVSAADNETSTGQIIEIGGKDVISYGEMMLGYAKERGLKRHLFPVPFLTPHLSSLWLGLVTPVTTGIAKPLIEGLKNETIVRNNSASEIFPYIKPSGYKEALGKALEKLEAGEVETAWHDSLSSGVGDIRPVTLTISEGMLIEKRQKIVNAEPERIFKVFTRIGGDRGWFFMNWTWIIRGLLDRVIGGVGLRRGRRDPDMLRKGDALDFWRVEEIKEPSMLRLRAEMRLPGKAWLQFSVKEMGPGKSLLTQTAYFTPKGLSGLIYWYLLYPPHAIIFSGLIKEIAKRSITRNAREKDV